MAIKMAGIAKTSDIAYLRSISPVSGLRLLSGCSGLADRMAVRTVLKLNLKLKCSAVQCSGATSLRANRLSRGRGHRYIRST